MLHVTFGTYKKQSFGSETTERQQESNPTKQKTRRNASRSGSETPERQQETTSRLKLKETTSRLLGALRL